MVVLGKLDKMVKEFVYQVSKSKGFPDSLAKEAGGKIFTYGSYRLGVHGTGNFNRFNTNEMHRLLNEIYLGADIDTLCVFPKHVEREHFFTIMYDMLKARPEVTELSVNRIKFNTLFMKKFLTRYFSLLQMLMCL